MYASRYVVLGTFLRMVHWVWFGLVHSCVDCREAKPPISQHDATMYLYQFSVATGELLAQCSRSVLPPHGPGSGLKFHVRVVPRSQYRYSCHEYCLYNIIRAWFPFVS